MRCRDALACSTAYVDGELDERRSRAVRGHLRTCAGCAAAFADEVAVREAAAALEPLEPPPTLWSRIEASLAEGEVAEAARSPAGLRLLCALDRLRRHALVGAVAVTAAVLVGLWLKPEAASVAPLERVASGAPTSEAVATETPIAAPIAAPSETVEAALAGELAEAVAHHEAVVEELLAAVVERRPQWTPGERARFDRELAASRAAVASARARIGEFDGAPAVVAAYRRQIALLTVAVSRRATVARIGEGGE